MAVDVRKVLEWFEIELHDEFDGLAWACCPKHGEKSPSWKVHLEGERVGQFYCFGCKWSGDMITLVRERMEVGFLAAKSFLEELPQELAKDVPIVRYEALHARLGGLKLPIGVTQAPLEEWIPIAREYATERHLTSEQVTRWRIGYAVGGRLDGRIVIPTYDAAGRLLSYTGRTFARSRKRYLEPAEEERSDRGAIFGEQHWPPYEARDVLVVLEGALNGLAVERALGTPFGGLHGSNLALEQVSKLATWRRLLVMTDPDTAGEQAAAKIFAAFARHKKVERVTLEGRQDPDSISPEALRDVLLPYLERET